MRLKNFVFSETLAQELSRDSSHRFDGLMATMRPVVKLNSLDAWGSTASSPAIRASRQGLGSIWHRRASLLDTGKGVQIMLVTTEQA